MKPLRRDPLRFELLELYSTYGGSGRISLKSPETMDSFLHAARKSVETATANPALLYGQRTQAMFEGLVASLGAAILLKHEDSGPVYATDTDLHVPDFRVVLPDGMNLLIEVKNCHNDQNQFILSKVYLDSLSRYAALANGVLKLAVYWSKWNIWTLVSPDVIKGDGQRLSLDLLNAVKHSEMYLLGDMTVGTRYPLSLKLSMKDSVSHGNGEFSVTIGRVELFCAGKEITDPKEKEIAFCLMVYGGWKDDHIEAQVQDDRIRFIDIDCRPTETTEGQDFEMVGALSEMFSRYYIWATSDGSGNIEQIHFPVKPGQVGLLIPQDFRGVSLPLWRFVVQPAMSPV